MDEDIRNLLTEIELTSDLVQRLALLEKLVGMYMTVSNLEDALRYSEQALTISREIQNKFSIAGCLSNMAIINSIQGNNLIAIELMPEVIAIHEQMDNKLQLLNDYANIGSMEYLLNNYNNALNYFLKSLSLAEETGSKQIGKIYNNLGNVYCTLNQLDKSLDYYQLALKGKLHNSDAVDIASSHINIGNVYRNKDDLDLAYENYSKALELLQTSNNKTYLAIVYNNLADIYMSREDYEPAIDLLEKSQEINKNLNMVQNQTSTLNNLANLYIKIKDYPKARTILDEAIGLANNINDNETLYHLYDSYAFLEAEVENYYEAFKYKSMYAELKSKLFTEDMGTKIAEIQTKFEIEKKQKEAEIYRLRNIELVQANQEIEQQKKELEKLNAAKNEFLGIVVHDLRNPITCILGLCDLMELTMGSNKYDLEGIQTNVSIIKTASQRMNELVHQLLDISAIEAGKISLNLVSQSLMPVIREREFYYQKLAEKKNIHLVIDRINLDYQVLLDRARILEVLDNLVTNAIKYTNPEGKVYLSFEVREDKFITHIKDTGLGLTPEEMEKIFISFQTFSARPTAGETSTGFGLLIVKKIIDLHQGEITVISEKDKGSTFSFSLPLAE